MTPLPCLVVQVKVKCVLTTKNKIGSPLLLAYTNFNVLLRRGSRKASKTCQGANNVFPSAALVQIWLLIIRRWQIYHLARLVENVV